MAELCWTEDQWNKVNEAVTDAFGKASVASAFLPLYGPLSGSAESVRNERLRQDDTHKPREVSLNIDHPDVNLKLANLTVNVLLSSEQVAEEKLSNAILAFRRAGNILAQEEDRIVFEGFGLGSANDDSKFVENTVKLQHGLADVERRQEFSALPGAPGATDREIVKAVVHAIHDLEDIHHVSPFACVLGNTLFEAVYTPNPNLVLAADSIRPMLKGGPLMRSGRMDPDTGIVVSLSGNAVDIVVGTPPTVQFLQRRNDAKFVFRVYEKFALRIRDVKAPVAGFKVPPAGSKLVFENLRLSIGRRRRQALANAQFAESED